MQCYVKALRGKVEAVWGLHAKVVIFDAWVFKIPDDPRVWDVFAVSEVDDQWPRWSEMMSVTTIVSFRMQVANNSRGVPFLLPHPYRLASFHGGPVRGRCLRLFIIIMIICNENYRVWLTLDSFGFLVMINFELNEESLAVTSDCVESLHGRLRLVILCCLLDCTEPVVEEIKSSPNLFRFDK